MIEALSIPGWMSCDECQELYGLAMSANGPILEIGHFLGRSTACICAGIRDSGRGNSFRSYDLGFRTDAEFREFYDRIHQRPTPVPDLHQQVFQSGRISTDIARENLERYGLVGFVELVSGNFIELDRDRYAFVFCDAVHETNEIRHNLPHIMERSASSAVWAFHDMYGINATLVEELSGARLVERVGSLGIFNYIGQHSDEAF